MGDWNPTMFGAPPPENQLRTMFGMPAAPTPAAPAPIAPTPTTAAPTPPAAFANPEQPKIPPSPVATDTQIAQSMLRRNADGSLIDPSSAELAALQNTRVLPNGQVIDAATANQLTQATGSGGGYYRKHFNSASEDYLKGGRSKELREQQYAEMENRAQSVLAAGAAGQMQAEQEVAAADSYMGVVRANEQMRMRAQADADKTFKQYQKDMDDAKKRYNVELSGGTDGQKGVRAGAMLFGGILAGLSQSFGAKAQILSKGTYQNTTTVANTIDGMISRDMQAQDMRVRGAKEKMTQVQEMYQDFRTKFNDDEAARQATLATAKDIFANQVLKAASAYKGTQAWENAQQNASLIAQSASENRDNANKLLAQVIDQNTHLLQSAPRPGVQLPTAAEKLMEQLALRKAVNEANKAGSGAELTEGGKGRVQKATDDASGYVTAGSMANELAGPNSPIHNTDRTLRALETGIIGGPGDEPGLLGGMVNAVGTAAKYPYAAVTGQSVDDAKAVAYREQAAMQPLRVAITGAGAGMAELKTLQDLISSPGSNAQKIQRYKEAVSFTARFIANKAPPDPAERRAYVANLRQSGVPDEIIRAAESGSVGTDRQDKTNALIKRITTR